jgi:dTDP-4-dehydrorhamnose 3,5-epimerase
MDGLTMSRFEMTQTPIADLTVLTRRPLGDARGYLERVFCADELAPLIPGKQIVQINRTLTAQAGTVRGMHFQHPPHCEIKFVNCIRGEVYDVAVDLRRNSETFLHWHGEVLSADNHKTLVVPEGFAHGFQTLTENCELLYFHTAAYSAEAESGINAEDARLNIAWPLPISERSERDSAHPALTDDYQGIKL